MKRRVTLFSGPAIYLMWAVICFIGFTLCKRSILLSDEGYIVYQASEIVRGKVLYRDLDAFVAPGIWLLLAAAFKVFGASVFVSRMVSFACYLATAAVLRRIVRRATDERYAFWVVVAYSLLSVWAFPAWHFVFYSAWSVLAALCALDRFLAWSHGGKPSALLLAGTCVGLSIVFKQNYGVLAGLAIASAVCAETVVGAEGVRAFAGALLARGTLVLAGALGALAPIVVYFWLNDALPDAIHSLVVRPFSEFATQHTLHFPPVLAAVRSDFFTGRARLSYEAPAVAMTSYPLITPPLLQRGVQMLHVALYWGPVLLFAVSAFLLLTRREASRRTIDSFACLAMACLVFLGVFPRADFNHLINVYQPILVLAMVVAYTIEARLDRGAARFRIIAFAVLIPYAAVAAVWYVLIVRSMTTELAMPRGGVKVAFIDARMITEEVELIDKLTEPNEPVLAMPGLAMLSFLAEREIPGAYANFFAVHIAHDGGRGVASALEERRVRWIVTENYDYFADDLKMREFAPELMSYVHTNYQQRYGIGIDRHWFLERRAIPRPMNDRASVLQRCDSVGEEFGERVVRSRLLYDGLYHRFRGPGVYDHDVLETRCTADVPPGGKLYFLLGYRQPDDANYHAAVAAEIWVAPSEAVESSQPLFSIVLDVTPASTWVSPPPEEHLIPLDVYSGREIVLTFRTVLTGDVTMNPFDMEGFAVVWDDVNIESTGASVSR